MIKCLCLHNDGNYYEEYAYSLEEYKAIQKGSYNDITKTLNLQRYFLEIV